MKRHLLLLNLLLVGLLVAGVVVLRDRWIAAEQRRAEILKAPSAVAAVKAEEVKAAAEPVRAASYFELVDKMLFSKDRNATVVVEIPKEKPMPQLPSAFGVMDLGDGPVVFLALGNGGQRGYRIGEKIGEFKLAEATSTDLTFEWEGKEVKRRLEELRAVVKESPAPAAAAAPINAPAAPSAVNASANPTPDSASKGNPKMGKDVNASSKYCDPSDTTPDGTVLDGFRKITRRTPFSTTCVWEKVE